MLNIHFLRAICRLIRMGMMSLFDKWGKWAEKSYHILPSVVRLANSNSGLIYRCLDSPPCILPSRLASIVKSLQFYLQTPRQTSPDQMHTGTAFLINFACWIHRLSQTPLSKRMGYSFLVVGNWQQKLQLSKIMLGSEVSSSRRSVIYKSCSFK